MKLDFESKPSRLRGPAQKAALIVVLIAGVCATRSILDPWLLTHLPYILFLAAVAAATRLAGWRAGAGTTAVSLLAGSFFFSEPRFRFSVLDADGAIEAVVFTLASALIVLLLEGEARLRRRLQLANERLRVEHSARIAIEHELQTARHLESLGKLAGGIAHDFNNLLTVILGSAELLSSKLPEERLALSIAAAAERGAELVKGLLRFAGREPVHLKPLSVNESVQETMALVERLMPEDIQMARYLSPELWLIEGDGAQVHQVMLNLLINARDALPSGGSIAITTANETADAALCARHPEMQPGEYVLLSIQDTGSGLSEEARARLFEPFFTTKPMGKGTGLGLAVVYGIVKQLQGHIFVSSREGAGTRFDLYWPRSRRQTTVSSDSAVQHSAQPGHALTILLVEDDDSVRLVTESLLRRLGHRVTTERDPAQALVTLRDLAAPLDVLVTDVVMPGMNGNELAERAKLLWPSMPVVYVSGYSENIIVSRGALKPGVILVRKPFTSAEIEDALRKATDGMAQPVRAS
jgi:signal transduction histidine kinase/ActR/RegA family two-component response regulator